MTEHTALRFDWLETSGIPVTEILGLNAKTMDDGSASWESVAICLGDKAVVITVEPDTDQVIVDYQEIPGGRGWESIPSFAFAHALVLGWCWVCINCQGYKDSVTVAFGDLVPDALRPRCMFVAAASTLSCFDLLPRRAA